MDVGIEEFDALVSAGIVVNLVCVLCQFVLIGVIKHYPKTIGMLTQTKYPDAIE